MQWWWGRELSGVRSHGASRRPGCASRCRTRARWAARQAGRAPGGEMKKRGPWSAMARESLALYPAFAAELEAESGRGGLERRNPRAGRGAGAFARFPAGGRGVAGLPPRHRRPGAAHGPLRGYAPLAGLRPLPQRHPARSRHGEARGGGDYGQLGKGLTRERRESPTRSATRLRRPSSFSSMRSNSSSSPSIHSGGTWR